jgi:hypothetical protein
MQIYSIFWNDIMKITNLINENVIIIFLKQKNRITLEIISISPINFLATTKKVSPTQKNKLQTQFSFTYWLTRNKKNYT